MRAIQSRIEMAGSLAPEVIPILTGTKVANHQSALKGLSKLPREEQVGAAKVLASGDTTKVEEAVKLAKGQPLLTRPPRAKEVTAPRTRTESGFTATASFLGRKVQIEAPDDGGIVTLKDLGRGSPHRAYLDDQDALSRDTIGGVIRQLMEELPTSISKDVHVDEPKQHTWLVECDIHTKFAAEERSRGMRLCWWRSQAGYNAGVIHPQSGPSRSIPVGDI